jgi:hypothetical protein
VSVGLGAIAASAVVIEFGVPAPGAKVLGATELEVLRKLAEVMFPKGTFPIDGVEAGVAEEVDRIVADVLEPIHANGFRTLLHTLEWGTLAGRGSRFTSLPLEERAEVVRIWSDPTVFTRRVAGDALKVVLGMAYFAHPTVIARIGWSLGCAAGGAS